MTVVVEGGRQLMTIADDENQVWQAHWSVELGAVQRAAGQPEDALISYQRAAAIQRRLGYVLGAFVRSRSTCEIAPDAEPDEDVYAALRVVSRLAPSADVVVNLRGAGLCNARLRFMRGVQVDLAGTDLAGASLPHSWTTIPEPAHQSSDAGDPESRSQHTMP